MSDPNNYTVGWISAIEIEYAAAQEFLDEEHEGPKLANQNDENHYTLGRIGKHNVVIAVLPRGDNGVAAAAMAAKDMMHSFPNVRICLMVGIGGGAPSKRHDIRLGDVVVSVPTYSGTGGNQGGVIQYDYGRTIQEKCFQGARYLNRPPRALLTAVNGLSTKYKRRGNDIDTTINNILQRNRRLQREYGRPAPDSDKLYSSDPVQKSGTETKLIERPKRSEMEDNPAIHYGLIASADGFMEDAQIRDILAEELDVLCFEMEAAGLMNSFPCLVIRGICDYSDRHWFKEWRGYAAMSAAAYAKALLEAVPAGDVDRMQTIKDLLPPELMEKAKHFIAPLWDEKGKEAISGSADLEETRTKDRSKDQRYQMPPTQAAVAQSPTMGDSDSEESQASDTDEDQCYHMPPNQAAAETPPAEKGFTNSQSDIEHVYIAVMGVTGAGKSSLISLCTGKNVKIGHNLESCTADVEDVEFMLNDHVCVHLIDTPGFDDTSRSDVEVLQNIAVWLSDSFEHGTKLSGIIYMHRIIDTRMAGSALRNLSMFKKLCGENAYSSVVLATSMWNEVSEVTGAQRERELIETPKFWGHMHKKGSRVFRLDRTRESCLEIVKYIISLGSTTLLELQDEIVNKGRQIEDTEAGVQLNEDIIRERKKHQAELLALKTQMQEEMAEHDAELQRALREEYDELKENIRRNDEEQAKLKQDLKDVHERKERELLELKKQIEADRKKYEEDMHNQGEALKRQAKEYADMIRLTEERSRKQWEMLEQKNNERDDRLRRAEEVNRKQQEVLALQAKEDANRANSFAKHGDTPLHLAARQGKADVVQKLLIQGAIIEAKDKYGGTPLYDAVYGGKEDTAKLLLDKGAKIEAPRNNGHTILHTMAAEGRADMVKFLLGRGAKIEVRTNDDETPLGLAIKHNKTDVAKLLLSRGANINARRTRNGWTELHYMAKGGKIDGTKFLLDQGANIEAKTNQGNTPLFLAIQNNETDVAKLLLKRGANIEARRTKNGWTDLHTVASKGNMDAAKFLLDHGAKIEAKTNGGSTPLGLAIANRKTNMANLLLNRGANIDARQNKEGSTELHIMAYKGKADMVKFLLDHGAKIAAKKKNGDTPLARAIANENANVVKLLRARGARG
ncbi:Ankyrin-3 [Trichoderma lentiforme]|uniref:protein S-acyltransferase n=1 Tax=Trichoderma lentiforme TaxID=1567552 RepID=A0A9P4XS50_9HYPO|nr:Ankyrin-3 [Trichoderma lentiforme]